MSEYMNEHTIKFPVELIKELRARTHMGLTDCTSAITESKGDIDGAISILKKKGLNRPDDLIMPTEGVCRAVVGESKSVIVEVSCQTDFAARSELFQNFVNKLIENNLSSVDDERDEKDREGLSAILREKVVIKRKQVIANGNDIVCCYNHGDKISVLVRLSCEYYENDESVKNFGNDLAMHIAAIKPLYINRDEVPKKVVEEKIYELESELLKKPEAIRAKIVAGKLDKWFAENVLLDQESVVHPKNTIGALMKKADPACDLIGYVRFEKGDCIKHG